MNRFQLISAEEDNFVQNGERKVFKFVFDEFFAVFFVILATFLLFLTLIEFFDLGVVLDKHFIESVTLVVELGDLAAHAFEPLRDVAGSGLLDDEFLFLVSHKIFMVIKEFIRYITT